MTNFHYMYMSLEGTGWGEMKCEIVLVRSKQCGMIAVQRSAN